VQALFDSDQMVGSKAGAPMAMLVELPPPSREIAHRLWPPAFSVALARHPAWSEKRTVGVQLPLTAGGTIKVGCGAKLTTFCDTLPRTRPTMRLRPDLPNTIMSARMSEA
jgi:hypothetical protein